MTELAFYYYSIIIYPVKMESVSKITIFVLKVVVKLVQIFLQIPPCGKRGFLYTEIVVLGKNLPLFMMRNNFPNGGISKEINSRPLFRPKMVILDADFLLTRYTIYE